MDNHIRWSTRRNAQAHANHMTLIITTSPDKFFRLLSHYFYIQNYRIRIFAVKHQALS